MANNSISSGANMLTYITADFADNSMVYVQFGQEDAITFDSPIEPTLGETPQEYWERVFDEVAALYAQNYSDVMDSITVTLIASLGNTFVNVRFNTHKYAYTSVLVNGSGISMSILSSIGTKSEAERSNPTNYAQNMNNSSLGILS